jgi:hypothetical protein
MGRTFMFTKLAAFAAICFGTFAVANADTLLLPGGSQPPDLLFPNGTILAELNGTVATATIIDHYTVIAYADNSNVFCAGCLDFLYVFNNVGPTANNSFTMGDFGGFLTDVGYNAGSGVATIPSTVERSSDGKAISFVFTPGLASGQDTAMLVIETDGTGFTSGFFTITDGTNTGSQQGFAPTPEPATLALFGTGLVGLVAAGRRKLKV